MKIFVAGHRGLAGSAIAKRIENFSNHNWVGKNRSELDLLDKGAVERFIKAEKFDAIILAAAKVSAKHS